MAKQRHPGTQKHFPSIATLIIDLLIQYIAQFAAVSPMFTLIYANNLKAQLLAAQNIPDQSARRATNNAIHQDLIDLNILIRQYFKALQDCIIIAFPTTAESQWRLAGWDYFKKGKNKNWNCTEQMIIMMITYINANLADLLANNNMRPTFLADFLLLATQFTTQHAFHNQSRGTTQLTTADKKTAYGNLTIQLRHICKAAQRADLPPSIRKQFDFKYLIQFISGTKPSGFKGKIVSQRSRKPIPFAILTFTGTPAITIHADKYGNYHADLPEGNHYGVASDPDPSTTHIPQPFLFCVKKGTTSTMNFQLLQ